MIAKNILSNQKIKKNCDPYWILDIEQKIWWNLNQNKMLDKNITVTK